MKSWAVSKFLLSSQIKRGGHTGNGREERCTSVLQTSGEALPVKNTHNRVDEGGKHRLCVNRCVYVSPQCMS